MVAQAQGKVVYVSGEETQHQIKLRSERLGITGENLYLMAETDLEVILDQIEQLQPSLVVIDSIQAVYLPGLDTGPGSVIQVRECTLRLMHWAKQNSVPILIAGHVTKDGAIAGPRVLEHIVDVVLYLEGEPFSAYRLLRYGAPCDALLEAAEKPQADDSRDKYNLDNMWGLFLWWRDKFF